MNQFYIVVSSMPVAAGRHGYIPSKIYRTPYLFLVRVLGMLWYINGVSQELGSQHSECICSNSLWR